MVINNNQSKSALVVVSAHFLQGGCVMVRSLVVLLAALCVTGLGHARNEGVTADEIRLGASAVLSAKRWRC